MPDFYSLCTKANKSKMNHDTHSPCYNSKLHWNKSCFYYKSIMQNPHKGFIFQAHNNCHVHHMEQCEYKSIVYCWLFHHTSGHDIIFLHQVCIVGSIFNNDIVDSKAKNPYACSYYKRPRAWTICLFVCLWWSNCWSSYLLSCLQGLLLF